MYDRCRCSKTTNELTKKEPIFYMYMLLTLQASKGWTDTINTKG